MGLKKMKDICINKGYRACVHKQHVSKAKIEAQYKKGGPHFGKVVPQKAIKKLAVKRKKCEKKTDFNCMKQSLKNLIDLNRKTAGDMIQKKAALMKLQKKVMPVVKELKIKKKKKKVSEKEQKHSMAIAKAKAKVGLAVTKKIAKKQAKREVAAVKKMAKAAAADVKHIEKNASRHPIATRGCGNTWSKAYCDQMLSHCTDHPVLRWKCRDICGACAEKFDYYKPGGGREIASLSTKAKSQAALIAKTAAAAAKAAGDKMAKKDLKRNEKVAADKAAVSNDAAAEKAAASSAQTADSKSAAAAAGAKATKEANTAAAAPKKP